VLNCSQHTQIAAVWPVLPSVQWAYSRQTRRPTALPACSVEVQNAWSCTSIAPICLHGVVIRITSPLYLPSIHNILQMYLCKFATALMNCLLSSRLYSSQFQASCDMIGVTFRHFFLKSWGGGGLSTQGFISCKSIELFFLLHPECLWVCVSLLSCGYRI
jgi:hypothetical protein